MNEADIITKQELVDAIPVFLLRYKFIPWNAGGALPKNVSVTYYATDTLDN